MNDSLLVSNVYAAYSAASKSERNVSELSQMARGAALMPKGEPEEDTGLNMDKVIISKEALERLRSMSLIAEGE